VRIETQIVGKQKRGTKWGDVLREIEVVQGGEGKITLIRVNREVKKNYVKKRALMGAPTEKGKE